MIARKGRVLVALGLGLAALLSVVGSLAAGDRIDAPAVSALAEGLVGHWRFDDLEGLTVPDASGLGNHGTLVNGPITTTTTPPVSVPNRYALEFDGDDDYVDVDLVAEEVAGGGGAWSASLWVKTSTPIPSGQAGLLAVNTITNDNVVILLQCGSVYCVYDAGGGGWEADSTTVIDDDRWHHLAYTSDARQGTLYVDGRPEATHPVDYTFATDNRWSLGQEFDPGGPSDFYTGLMDEVRVYTRTLSAQEVVELAAIIFVDADAAGAATGLSWTDAFTDVQTALSIEQASADIWVAAGTYTPTVEHGGTGDRFRSFQLRNSFALYGGFDPSVGDVAFEDRNWEANRTVLSGDMGVQGQLADNSYHVFYHPAGMDLDSTAVLDGFIITGGNADAGAAPHWDGGGMYNTGGSSPVLRHCTFLTNSADFGGGLYNNVNSSPALVGCTFEGNSARYLGGGMYSANGSPTLTNCVFEDNSAGERGGGIEFVSASPALANCAFEGNSAELEGSGIYNRDSQLTLTNCTFEGNSAVLEGSGIYNEDSQLTLANSILWSNGAGMAEDQIFNEGTSTAEVTYSDIQGGWPGTGNINADPLFADADGGLLWLRPESPAIDAGDSDAVPIGVTTDLGGNPRFVDMPAVPDTGTGQEPIVDMGAYEALPPVLLPVTLRIYSPFTNGGFEYGWAAWTQGGALPRAITSAEVHEGVYAALLGSPAYNCRGGVPVGSAWLQQTFTVPGPGVSALRIWYRIYSEDTYGQAKYDRFQILVNGVVVKMDGNQSGTWGCDPGPQSAGWEYFDLDLSPYWGQNITLRLENVSADDWFNTWTYVDDLQFLP